MPPRPASLSLTMPIRTSAVSSTITSPTDAESNSTSPHALGTNKNYTAEPSSAVSPSPEGPLDSPDITSLPPFPSSPKEGPRHSREASKGFFSNLKASKSSNKVHNVEPTIRKVSEDIPRSEIDIKEARLYSLRKGPGSTPDLSLSNLESTSTEYYEPHQAKNHKIPRRPIGSSIQSDSLLITNPTNQSQSQKPKPKPRFGTLLTRTRSTRMEDGVRKTKLVTPIYTSGPEIRMQYDGISETESPKLAPFPMTAPLQQEDSLRDMLSSSSRNRSADRQAGNSSSENVSRHRADRALAGGLSASSSGNFRERGGSHVFTNLKATSSKAADGLNKAGKGFMGKFARSGSTTTKEEEPYVLHIINLPLIEQTRHTRIAKRLANSRDKTEFWMPALPWRCIDFLNYKGCEEEGLYRVPGSDVQIKRWQKRFDQEGDINLFDERDLYDINTIGSLFKAWLRGLPTEIFPKKTQAKIAEECAGAHQVPQLLKDELSSLPPWNYYLLFAITCHLSLLTAYAEQNKMTYSNLCICFQPALKVDGFCFQFLVQDWRKCWQGCWTEKEYLEEEYRVLDGPPSSSGSFGNHGENGSVESTPAADERSLASAGSHKPTMGGRSNQTKPPPLSLTKASEERLNMPDGDDQNGYATTSTQLPALEPMVPLSPIGHLT